MKFGVGQPVPRTEDPRFLKGQGQYVDDITFPGQVHGYVLRSPHAHADVTRIDTTAAREGPGVLLVLTGDDIPGEGVIGIPHFIPPMAFGAPPPKFSPVHPVLVNTRVRHVGDPVAFIVAETLDQAKDAAERIVVDYDILPAIASTANATAPGVPQVWEEAGSNTWFTIQRGDQAGTDAVFAKAAHVTRLPLINNRLICNAIEPRAAIANYLAATDHWTVWTESQAPHAQRTHYAKVFGKPESHFRVISPDVGGGFGMKNGVYCEEVMVIIAARRLQRPVRWTADRSESLVSDAHARDAVSDAELALDGEGKFLAMRVKTNHAVGAYLGEAATVPVGLGSTMYVGSYDLPICHIQVNAVFTNTTLISPYRGAGRPEAGYVIERLVDAAAVEMGIDPVELRRRNYIKQAAMPYETAIGSIYDSGEFERVTDLATELTDVAGFAARRAESEARGKLRGLGITFFIEIGAPFNDRMQLYFDPTGGVTVAAGTHSHGQGHQTIYAQMVSEWLGVDFESVRLVQGDSDAVAVGRGTYGARSATIGGSALKDAADQIINKAKKMSAHLMEAAEADIEFADGTFTVAGTDKSVGIVQVAQASFMPMGWPAEFGIGLEATGTFTPTNGNFPNGCHICEVEIDRDTGHVALVRYGAVDDSGVILNPLLFEGQIHGGLAQGIGQALCECAVYDPDSGQLMSGSFMDYCMPRAHDLPSFPLDDIEVPCTSNPLGVKGAGETGTVGAVPAVVHAILDALRPLGVDNIQMPATPQAVWQAMRDAQAS